MSTCYSELMYSLMCCVMAGRAVLQTHPLHSRQNLWVLCGGAGPSSDLPTNVCITSFHSSVSSKEDTLQRFWEIEEAPLDQSALSNEERMVVRHFDSNHSCSREGRFVVPLPRDPSTKSIGESRSQAVRRFLSLEHSLTTKGVSRSLMMSYKNILIWGMPN